MPEVPPPPRMRSTPRPDCGDEMLLLPLLERRLRTGAAFKRDVIADRAAELMGHSP